ncbi:PREDICTED: cytochrome P450 9e2-like isoform X1 [Vollenhovia emeryi]|uniref:cytochrome P450 9e2-like isoform X1 n=1 Tax=Vollenhovia emeryi TaxID=411798 RepID=UPI0005F4D5BE|nr:PREDICTED: cytochrome P450 9e2-like isoform X1 [Vollenhovia emeryi]XP_011864118.1 PREDICTED: cytochrome P450 9e2-like isoform X1 [Vollenhovia emeryi]
MNVSILLSIVIGILAVVHYLFRNFNFFKRQHVIHIPSMPILGSLASLLLCQSSFVELSRSIYNFNRDATYIGFYAMTRPMLMLRDPKLIKEVAVKNFDKFPTSPVFLNFNDYVFTRNLFALQDTKRWRNLRNLLSPFFSSAKMKALFTLMSECAVVFTELISTLPEKGSDMNMSTMFDRYTNDVIALCCYGMETNSMKDPTNKFYIFGKRITHLSIIASLKFIFIRTFPRLGRLFNIKIMDNQEMRYFQASIRNEITTRYATKMTRPDMIQLMIDNNESSAKRVQLDMDEMIAQAYAFYFAGFETSSAVMSFIAYNIVTNPDVQIKLQQEIDEILKESNGNVTYETINQLEYLNAVVKEALRHFAPSVIERVCNEDFELPPALPGEKPFIVKKGMMLWIPIHAVHHDEKYYDNPDEFFPERFLDNKIDTSLYFPFGLGPKMCMGNRFATLMTKIVIFHLLARCDLKPCSKTKSLTYSKKILQMMPENGFWLNVKQRNNIEWKSQLDRAC